jgi:hypothetical protein
MQLNTLVLESWKDRSPHGLRGRLNRKLTIVSKHLTKMESIDGECNSQMKIPWSSGRPEDKFPIVEPAFTHYSKTPYRFQKCLHITKAKSNLVIFPRLMRLKLTPFVPDTFNFPNMPLGYV